VLDWLVHCDVASRYHPPPTERKEEAETHNNGRGKTRHHCLV
jgi:hypothetical protein